MDIFDRDENITFENRVELLHQAIENLASEYDCMAQVEALLYMPDDGVLVHAAMFPENMDIFNALPAEDKDFCAHVGMPGRSGRYAHGSGENPHQHCGEFANSIRQMRRQGMTEKDICTAMGMSSTELRSRYAQSANEEKAHLISSAKTMREDGKSTADIARRLNQSESTVRGWLKNGESMKKNTGKAKLAADFLKEQVDSKGMILVSSGTEKEVLGGVSREKMKQALDILDAQGYKTFKGGVPQVTNKGKQTNMVVLCPPDTPYMMKIGKDGKEREVSAAIYDFENVHTISDYTMRTDKDGSEHVDKRFEYPASMDSGRIKIRYANEVGTDGYSGVEKDGLVEIRRGVKDLDLGASKYAQVRILVDDNRYIKGMAVYSDHMPDGVDIVFNTNKKEGTPMIDPDPHKKQVLKPITDDPNNPFGALIKENGGQSHYTDIDGNRKLSLINKKSEEGDWSEWADTLPSQFLSKQPKKLVKDQLDIARKDKEAEYHDILEITNPTVKKQLLETFANDCDTASIHLKAAALPGQKYEVLIPVPSLKDNEVYAPRYVDGTKLALIRYPHAGTFEIPILTVNNKNKQGKEFLGDNPYDAVGINSKNAVILSGADFDGDTAMVIPCNMPGKIHVENRPPLQGLVGFEPKDKYGTDERVESDGSIGYYRDGKKILPMSEHNSQIEMGKVTNLIMDMTLKGAPDEDVAAAVRHSMVVIDAKKHHLDYKASEEDNHIRALKDKWQIHLDDDGNIIKTGGSSTFITLAKSDARVDRRVGQPKINKKGEPWYDPSRPEGALIYKSVHETYIDKDGKEQTRTIKVPKGSLTDDSRTLASNNAKDILYADYANAMKNMANRARLEYLSTKDISYDRKAAKDIYPEEVRSLEAKLSISERNAPRETKAQLAANAELKMIFLANPNMSNKDKKKQEQQVLTRMRDKFGAHRQTIDIQPREWDAIQAGAISSTKLKKILRYADTTQVRQYATPRAANELSPAKQARIKSRLASGYSAGQIAEELGISPSTVNKYAKKMSSRTND